MSNQGSRFQVAFNCETPNCGGDAIASHWETSDEARAEADRILSKQEFVWAECPTCRKSRKYTPAIGHHDTYPFVRDTATDEDPGFAVARM